MLVQRTVRPYQRTEVVTANLGAAPSPSKMFIYGVATLSGQAYSCDFAHPGK